MDILIIDDHLAVAYSFKILLEARRPSANIKICASWEEANTFENVIDPALIWLDYHMPGIDGLELLKKIRGKFKKARIVIVSGENSTELISETIRHGASGFIPKTMEGEELLSKIDIVLNGGIYLPPQISMSSLTDNVKDSVVRLTNRQQQIFGRVLRGYSNKLIATELDIAEGTVKSHIHAIFKTLKVRNRVEAVIAASRDELII